MVAVPKIQTVHYGEHSFKSRSVNAWYLYQRNLKTDLITFLSSNFSPSSKPVPAMSLMMRLRKRFINSNQTPCLFSLFCLLVFHH